VALAPWVRTVAYCERDRYAQAVLLSRQASGDLDAAPVWDDITTSPDFGSPKWISFSGAHPARTSALQGMARAWKVAEADYFSRYAGSSTKSAQRSSSWKTSRPLGPVEQNEWSKNWPASGMTVDGRLYPLLKSEHRTYASDGSSLLPTPSASSYGTNKGGSAGRVGKERPSLQTIAKRLGGRLNPVFVEWMMGYPMMWTVLEPWVTPWCPLKRGKRSKS
jgi:hypothetical protein